ncbi:glycosyltransferase family 2 protein [Mucilaginibacter litoreus]|uniref:Glycosyltransferase family 2 protein n=1 Tax=Mucilaginibacter litoreus TaxID=1048221 RepID=A0ABW3AVF9_9SPHI
MNSLALCIPAYNAAIYLPRLLQSAQKQVIPFNEILVYNDCSTDDTAAVAESYGATVITGNMNMGCSYGKNKLAEVTTSDWIHFHDADDELLPNFTTLAHNWLKTPDCPDVVLFDYEWRDNNTGQLLAVVHFDKNELEKDATAYAIQNQINPFCGLYKKPRYLEVGGYDIDPLILYNEDKAFHIKLAKNGLTFSAESEVSIINYRIENSMSAANIKKCVIAQYHVLEQTVATHGQKYTAELAEELFKNAAVLAKEDAWDYVNKALRLARNLGHKVPSNAGKAFRLLISINPFMAMWLREKLIRLFKPHLRNA